MQAVINDFEDRVKEVDLYFDVLLKLYGDGVKLSVEQADGSHSLVGIDSDFLIMLKANSFLLIYNLVESSIREGILAIYNELKARNYSFMQVREEIRQIWINYHYRNVFDQNANYSSYRDQARLLVDMAVSNTTINLDRTATGISGNLDAEEIRKLCDRHGINKYVSASAQGGAKLQVVKDQRNALAHGSLSFLECGRQFTDSDLVEIKNQSVLFVRDILSNMKDYMDQCLYDIANVP